MSERLATLRDAVIEDGKVDDSEVVDIREEIFADDAIDQDEAVMLFEINDAVTGNPENSPLWGDLFVEAVTSFVLDDEDSTGSVDDAEAQFLVDQIGADGQIDALEERLLDNIRDNATSISPILDPLLNR